MKDIKFYAYYLPQFHTIPENDKWWGDGFTEWINVKKAKPLFKGHKQPIIPGELGYYDLINQKEIQEEQSKLALEHGIDGFIYYQYWFGENKMLLEKPAQQMLKNKNVKIPFCFCWANETWKGVWHGLDDDQILIEQKYSNRVGYEKYFNYLLPFFQDSRYIKLDNKPMFHIYRVDDIPNLDEFIIVFNELALKVGFAGVYFVATIASEKVLSHPSIYAKVGVDIFMKMRNELNYKYSRENFLGKFERKFRPRIDSLLKGIFKFKVKPKPLVYDYSDGVCKLNMKFPHKKYVQCVFPNWDNSPRTKSKSLIFKNSNPKSWGLHLNSAIKELLKNDMNPQFIVIKSWNEWAEGNYLEPDSNYGLSWLNEVKKAKRNLLGN